MTDRDLIFAAAQLSRSAPQDWTNFLSAFAAYTDDRRDECVQAPPTMLQVAQGRAQACAALRKLFADCAKQASNIEAKRPSPPHKPR